MRSSYHRHQSHIADAFSSKALRVYSPADCSFAQRRALSNHVTRATFILGATVLYYNQSSKSMGILFDSYKSVWLVGYQSLAMIPRMVLLSFVLVVIQLLFALLIIATAGPQVFG